MFILLHFYSSYFQNSLFHQFRTASDSLLQSLTHFLKRSLTHSVNLSHISCHHSSLNVPIFFLKARSLYIRLKLAKKLSTLLSTPQAEILEEKIFVYYFSVLLLSRYCKSSLTSIFSLFKKININRFLSNCDFDAILFKRIDFFINW